MSKLGTRSYPDRDLKLLFGLSAGRCAFPACHRECIEPGTAYDRAVVTGQIAHIEAHSDAGPRANQTLTKQQRDSYENWILLCANHHIVVDGQENTYTSADLRLWKAEHERWVGTMYQQAMPGVTFVELTTVAMAILNNPLDPTESFVVTPPGIKMKKNLLTGPSTSMLMLGIGKARDVAAFLESMSRLDYQFPERLRAGFVEHYKELIRQDYKGDDLFTAMQEFATGTSTDFKVRAAGLAVLSYLFEVCEVFEP